MLRHYYAARAPLLHTPLLIIAYAPRREAAARRRCLAYAMMRAAARAIAAVMPRLMLAELHAMPLTLLIR